jgi:hypothetical protein
MEEVAGALLLKATNGDVSAIKEIADRIDGKVPQCVGGDKDLGPVLVRWCHEDEDPGVILPVGYDDENGG